MLSFGASVLNKGLTRAETLPNPKPAELAATTRAAAGRTSSTSAGTTPESKSSSTVGRFASVVGLRSKDGGAAAADSRLEARQKDVQRKDLGDAVTEQRRESMMASAFSRFKCAKCGQGFSSAGSLALHERVHLGEKPYVCPLCGEGFANAGKLHRHNVSERNGAKQNWGKAKLPESETEQAGSREEKSLLGRQKSLLKKTTSIRRTASSKRG
jgi:hypothetical protein